MAANAFTLFFWELTTDNVALVGGKNASLGLLQAAVLGEVHQQQVPARLIDSPADGHRLQPGKILVPRLRLRAH